MAQLFSQTTRVSVLDIVKRMKCKCKTDLFMGSLKLVNFRMYNNKSTDQDISPHSKARQLWWF